MNRVKEYRKLAGLTQTALAKKAKISRPYLSAIEKGTQITISNVVMGKIADALNITITEIFFSSIVVCKQHKKDVSNERVEGIPK